MRKRRAITERMVSKRVFLRRADLKEPALGRSRVKDSKQREQCVQRPWGRNFHAVLRYSKKICGWSQVREEERRRKGDWTSNNSPMCTAAWPLQGFCTYSEESGSHGRILSTRGTGSDLDSNRVSLDIMVGWIMPPKMSTLTPQAYQCYFIWQQELCSCDFS